MQKEKIQEVIDTFPEDVDVDEFLERVYLLRKIEIAEAQLAAGEGIPHDEARKRLAQWLT